MLEMTVCFVLSIAAFIISVRSFMEKGFLLNNAYLFASEQERKAMNKGPYYRQSAIVFFLLGILFALLALQSLLKAKWLLGIAAAVVVITLAYAIVSSLRGK